MGMEVEVQEVKLSKEITDRLLTPEELKSIREIIEQNSRVKWLWASLRTWILFASAVVAFFTIGLDGIKTILKRLVE